MKTTAHLKLVPTHGGAVAPDDKLLEDFDDLVAQASRGDRHAIRAIALALGPSLLAEAKQALGPPHEIDAEDVVQEFYVLLLESRVPFIPGQGRAIQWMCSVIRVLADRWLDQLTGGP
jgi:DNA-directed RNA polymerase specialized sigma24 family protein